jgi:6,7-dimethyl-8-ribityllumazine synthase
LGVTDSDIDVVWVPGAFEIPQTVHWMETSNSYDGIMTLGCVIRGDTPHFDFVAKAASSGLTRLGLSSKTPVVFGVLTCDTVEQAQTRSGIKSNKGVDVADGLVELINVRKKLNIS